MSTYEQLEGIGKKKNHVQSDSKNKIRNKGFATGR